MNIKELRESIGMRQKELADKLRAEGINATCSDISRIENGAIETYLYLAFRAEEIIQGEITLGRTQKPTEAKISTCKCIEADRVYERIVEKGYTDYNDLQILFGADDKREIRAIVQETRSRYPIIDREGGGWTLATSIAECDKQIGIYEKKKRVYSRQETPLIAKKYQLKKEMGI